MDVRDVLPVAFHRGLAQRCDKLLRVTWPLVILAPTNLIAENLATLLECSVLYERLLPGWRGLDPRDERFNGLCRQKVVLLIEVAGDFPNEGLFRRDDLTDDMERCV